MLGFGAQKSVETIYIGDRNACNFEINRNAYIDGVILFFKENVILGDKSVFLFIFVNSDGYVSFQIVVTVIKSKNVYSHLPLIFFFNASLKKESCISP